MAAFAVDTMDIVAACVEAGPGVKVRLPGITLHVSSAGAEVVQVVFTVPTYPAVALAVSTAVPDLPLTMLMLLGLADMVKVPTG